MATPSDYDGNVALDVAGMGKLTDEETKDLKENRLQALFGTIDEDIGDILDYSFAMVNNGKTMDFVAKEILSMEFCSEDKAHAVVKVLAEYIQEKSGGERKEAPATTTAEAEGGNKRVVSLKSKSEGNALALSGALGSGKKKNANSGASTKGNALTMAGALGASRERDSNKQKQNRQQQRDDNRGGRGGGGRNRDGRNRDDQGNNMTRRDGRGRGDRDRKKSSRHSDVFDRLANRDDNNNGRNRNRRNDESDWGPPRRGGRGGRSSGGRGGQRFSGQRRDRGEMEHEEDYMAAPQGDNGGRGRGRGRGGQGQGAKRMRVDGGGRGGPDFDPYFEENYDGYNDGSYYYPPQAYHYPPRGRGRGRGRGRFGGRGRGRFAPAGEDPSSATGGAAPAPAEGAGEQQGGDSSVAGGNMNGEAAEYHPSPIVGAAYGYSYGGYRGGFRGRGFRGRGFRGRGGGRAHVAGMIASKAWVRPKDSDASNAAAGGGAAGANEGEGGEAAPET